MYVCMLVRSGNGCFPNFGATYSQINLPKILMQLHFIAENSQRLATTLTSLERSTCSIPLACTVYNTLEGLNVCLEAGVAKTSARPKTYGMLDKSSSSARKKAVKEFQTVFKLSFDKQAGHLPSLPACTITIRPSEYFDPRQLTTSGHDIGECGN